MIARPDDEPLGIAGIWADSAILKDEAGDPQLSFSMLTVNADGHPIFQRVHAPEDEKRVVVILEPGDYTRWIDCPREDAPEFIRQFAAPLEAQAAPRPPAKPRASTVIRKKRPSVK